ncbi:MAG: hypothetical protein QOD90_2637 [Mycobacterium sp.]|jgi:hypothetical protein|nr:hypothetical protein [Mycobacterium sp.]
MSTGIDEQAPTSDSALPDDKQRIYEAVRDIAEKRALIDQAKGMLMIVYGIDADAAFGLLRWQSQHHNVKLRLMAEQLLEDFSRASQQGGAVDRRIYDELLVTIHTRTEPAVLRDVVGEMAVRIDD